MIIKLICGAKGKEKKFVMFPAVLRIRDTYPGSRILIFTHPGSRISDGNKREG
jgi:hypothetical protein